MVLTVGVVVVVDARPFWDTAVLGTANLARNLLYVVFAAPNTR